MEGIMKKWKAAILICYTLGLAVFLAAPIGAAADARNVKYTPFISAEDQPPLHLNKKIMDTYRPKMRKYYFNPGKYKTYLEQLGIVYPTIRVSKKK